MTELNATALLHITFPPADRGYDMQVVDQFVDDMRNVLATHEDTISQLSQQVSSAPAPEAPTVIDQSVALLRHAQTTAEKVVAEAREEANAAVAEARTLVEELLADATAEAERTRAAAQADLVKMEQQLEQLRAARADLTADLTAAANRALALASPTSPTEVGAEGHAAGE